MKKLIFIYIVLVQCLFSYSQNMNNECVDEIIKAENKLTIQKFNSNGKPSFLSYKVWTEDWDKKIVHSEVKLYRNEFNMHLFSDQVTIYTDQHESFMILKPQMIIMAGSTSKELLANGMNADFLKFRNLFLKNCIVESCKITDSLKGIKTVKLVVNEDFEGVVSIKSMIYKYNMKEKKVLSTTVYYDDSYKLKIMAITYHSFEEESDYSFLKPRKYVLSMKGKLLPIYKGFQLIDERENKK